MSEIRELWLPAPPCVCIETSSTSDLSESGSCVCPRNEHDIVIHRPDCALYKNETFVNTSVCECDIEMKNKNGTGKDVCKSARKEGEEQCKCFAPEATENALDEFRKSRKLGAMPAVLEATHPLMQRFQETLKEFLLKENALAEKEIMNLKEDLRLTRQAYDKDLETIYKSDQDCNAQRILIEEYESSLAERTTARLEAEKRTKELNEEQKCIREQLYQDMTAELELRTEMEALTALCQQLEKWREEMQSELTISQSMSEKMRVERRTLVAEKREMDMYLFGLNNEVWKLESKLEIFKKQMEVKSVELEKVNDKVASYGAELEDLDLDKRRLVSLWNGVLNNISQRDKIFDSVRVDYVTLQDNFRSLISNLDITKKVIAEELNKGIELAMTKDKLIYDEEKLNHLLSIDNHKRTTFETEIGQVNESIDMTDKDTELIKSENFALRNILKSSEKEYDHKVNKKLKLENELLANLQDCLLNDKAVESMANGIKNLREMSRKQEISLMVMEAQHARLLLDLELRRSHCVKNGNILEKTLAQVKEKENELNDIQKKYDKTALAVMNKTRDLDLVVGKYTKLKEIFDAKTPQQKRIESFEEQIKDMRSRTLLLQNGWLRLQGHVVKLTEQYHKVVTETNLIRKQLQICEQKSMHIQADCEKIAQNKLLVDRNLREIRGRLQVLEKTRKDATERNHFSKRTNINLTQEHAANLKNAEMQIIELEEEISATDKEKDNLIQELDHVRKEALIWQRKGILAVELRKNMKEAKSSSGDIGIMRHEIHRMEARRDQLRRTGEKLAENLANYVTRRENALEKTRAAASVEKAHGSNGTRVSQSAYHHKLRLAKSDVASATKQLNEAETVLKQLQEEHKCLECDITETKFLNTKLEEMIARSMLECREADRQNHWLLERVVRKQRYGSELAIAIRRQSVKPHKSKPTILKEYNAACALNERIYYILETIYKEYPHFEDKLAIISNTLNIRSPATSPRFAVSPCLCEIEEVDENIAEKPFEASLEK